MSNILGFIARTFSRPSASQDESYLAQAQDLADLERRIRYLENGQLDPVRNPIVSFG